MTTPPKIPAWITQPERVPGHPCSRVDSTIENSCFCLPKAEGRAPTGWENAHFWHSHCCEAITAFDAKCAEVEEQEIAHDGIIGSVAMTRNAAIARAEAAEAECERLRVRNAEMSKALEGYEG